MDNILELAKDPVHYENGLWYFWDETWGHRHGPYITRKAAVEALEKYAENL